MRVSKDKVLTIEYKMIDKEGQVLASSDDNDALSFIQGRESVFPIIEDKVDGHSTGARITFEITPEQAYGQQNPDLVRVIPRKQFNFDGEITIGMKFTTRKNDRELDVTVIAVTDDEITIDANHPLAGVSMNMDLVIVDVRDALPEELESGIVQEIDEIYRQEQLHNAVQR
jgi:FKBP-type peptidyl-prolyl cis-trans isomerase SlyD